MLRRPWRIWVVCVLGGLLSVSLVQDTVSSSRRIFQEDVASKAFRRSSSVFQVAKAYTSKLWSTYLPTSSSSVIGPSLKSTEGVAHNRVSLLSLLYAKPPLGSVPLAETPAHVTPAQVHALQKSVFTPSFPTQIPLPVNPPQSSPSIHPKISPGPQNFVESTPPQEISHVSVPAPAGREPVVSQPFSPQHNSPPAWLVPVASPPRFFLPTPPLSPLLPEYLPSPDTPMAHSPLTSPSAGCCVSIMMLRPGLPIESCSCVYPIKMELLVYNVSIRFMNWSAELQQELASQLNLSAIQIEIASFHFYGSNLDLLIEIGPLTSVSFTPQQAYKIRTGLRDFQVHLNSSLFGNYTLKHFRYFQPTTSSPFLSTPAPALSQLPLSQILPQVPPVKIVKNSTLSLAVVIGIVVGSIILILAIGISIWKWAAQHRTQKNDRYYSGKGISSRRASIPFDTSSHDGSLQWPMATRLFSFEELKAATNNFESSSVLGEGGFGRVYKGILKDGTAVAIKRFTGGGHQGNREFLVEVEILSRLHHRNLVKLVGYYTSHESCQHLLCYELVPNGSLEAWLHGPLGANHPLDWDTRKKIALDAARGLAYLHEDSKPSIIHRDFKASNILLDNSFHAKVADFGLAKQAPEDQRNYMSTRIMGTFGYVAPEYAMTGHLLVKSDVYSYGVVLFELLSGRRPVDRSQSSGQENLISWARQILRDKGRLGELVDPRLLAKFPKEEFVHVAAIAAACVAPEASQRPTMGEVVQSLKMVQYPSEYPLSGERGECANETAMLSSMSNRSFTSNWQNTRQTSTTLEYGSSSVFSSGPLSGLSRLDNESLSNTAVFSEDLQEGR